MDKIKALVQWDKAQHFAGMMIIASAFALVLALEGLLAPDLFHAHSLAFVLVNLGMTVGALKEAEDHADNQIMKLRGEAPIHSVEFFDFLATTLGAAALAGALVCLGLA